MELSALHQGHFYLSMTERKAAKAISLMPSQWIDPVLQSKL
jgi:hypothetical protein